MLPVYDGDRMLAAICTGVLAGLGYGMIYMRNSSTGGADFVIMSVKAWKPHVSIGQIAFVMDVLIVLMGSFIFPGRRRDHLWIDCDLSSVCGSR